MSKAGIAVASGSSGSSGGSSGSSSGSSGALKYGDFDKWLAATIEALVREDKKTSPAAVEEKQTQIATTAATAAASVAATVAQTAAAQVVAEAETPERGTE